MALPTEEELREARGAALDAKFVADGLKARWELSQRHADRLMTHYRSLLDEYQGQLSFDTEEP